MSCIENLEKITSILSDIATVVAVGIGYTQYHKWRDQEITRTKAKVAIKAIATVRRIASTMDYLTSELGKRSLDPSNSNRPRLRELYKEMRKRALNDEEKSPKKIEECQIEVDIYLDPIIAKVFKEYVETWDRIDSLLSRMTLEDIYDDIPSIYEQHKEEVFGDESRKMRNLKSVEIQDKLKPIARLGVPN